MAYNFLACDRDQAFLLPPDLCDWLPSDHLAWFILDVVDQLDLGPFLKAYRADGHGRAAYEPRMLLAVLLYACCTGVRSSRQIEQRCHEVELAGAGWPWRPSALLALTATAAIGVALVPAAASRRNRR
jgi:transposase